MESHILFHKLSSLKCAIELGIPDIIHKHRKPITLSRLSAALSIPPSRIPCIQCLMRLLVQSKFFANERSKEEVAYSLTTFFEILLSEKSICVSPFVLLMMDQILLRLWPSLSDWFKKDEPSTTFELAYGVPVCEVTRQIAKFNNAVHLGLSSNTSFTSTDVIIRDCSEVFSRLTS